MPLPSNAKKTPGEGGSSKKAATIDVTPLRISSRVRKEKFSVKELFSTAKDKDSSDDEPHKPSAKRKVVVPPVSAKSLPDKESKVHMVRVDVTKSSSKQVNTGKAQETSTPKPSSSKTTVTSKTIQAKKLADATSKDDKSTKVTSPKAKQGKSSLKEEEKFDPLVVENIKIEPIFNEDNIDTVLENPSSLGLDIVVTKLSDSDQRDQNESKKSKNVVTIAKVTGSSPVSKPIKVVPMKPNDKMPESSEKPHDKTLDFKGSGVVITPKLEKTSGKNMSIMGDKKSKVLPRPASVSKISTATKVDCQAKDSKAVKSLSSDVVVVTQTIDNKGTISTKAVEKKRDVMKQPELKAKSKLTPTIVEVDLDKTKGKVDYTTPGGDKSRDIQRQKAIKRSMLDMMSDVKANGHKAVKSSKVKSAEADSSSHEIDIKKAKVLEEIFGDMDSETQSEEIKKPAYEFDRYFTTSESIIEHNESLDSDGSNEGSETYLSHFYEKETLNNNKRMKLADSSCQDSEEYTIYDLMYEVNCEYPSWNLHVMQDTASFLICQVTRGAHGLPTMSKMIELDPDFSSAKVYVNEVFHREFCGSYGTYESIRELIANVQQISIRRE